MDNMSLNYKSKQQIFFLTKADIVKMMTVVERKIPIKYALIGAFKHETIRIENTISNFSKLGHTGYVNWISLDNRYMVLPLNNEVKYRIVKHLKSATIIQYTIKGRFMSR